MSASFHLGPPKESAFSLFLKSQFHDPERPPEDTNLKDQVAIVTGSTSGLGLEASRQFLSLNLSRLIIAVRSTSKGEQVAAEFRAQHPEADIQVWPLEMESYDSIQAFACRADAELSRLDIVILNAGMQSADFSTSSSTRHEKLSQVNYLSTMWLAALLLPALKAKLTIVNSGTARGATISIPIGSLILPSLDDKSQAGNPLKRYSVSKLLGHLFLINLVRYVSADDVVVNLVDPAMVKDTGLQRGAPLPLAAFFYYWKAMLGRTLPVGASTYVDAAVVKGKESHEYIIANWGISSFPAFVYTPEAEAIREQLWKETMAQFEFPGIHAILEGLNV